VVNPVDTSVEGIYVVTYDVSDEAGNAATQLTRTVTVDGTSPVISLVGANPINLAVNATYTDPGATASDNFDGDITANIVPGGDTVDTAVEGTYVVTYDVSDAAGNAATQVTRTVIVGDPPEITLVGANPLKLKLNDTYIDPGATALDVPDGDITGDIIVGGDTVDTAVEGTYVVTYNVDDSAGNAAQQVTRTVIVDGTLPVITLIGASTIKLPLNGTYTEFSGTASDDIDGVITANINIGGDTVNTAVEDTYVVTYNVSDEAGNAAIQLTRTVIVDGTPPVITLIGANPLEISVGGTYTDPGATANDDIDGDITPDIVPGGDTVVTTGVNSFTVTYDVSDEAGNAATQKTRTVNVVNDPPVISAFTISPDPAFISSSATFNWAVDDVNG
ncbi:MAG: DUF5011 domain-containing protein, partial [Aestuariibacter sp.]|nr:DUF5011 domain-containing protein [Aestuariibacter sp.]